MPLVRILRPPTGFRDGVEWPAAGGTLDVPELEADDLVRIGVAERVAPAKAAPEAAVAVATETAAAPKPRARKS